MQNHQIKETMKKLITLFAVASMSLSAYAGCGKKVTDEGTLKAYDAEKKEVTVTKADGKTATITLTPKTEGADKVAGLVGKEVKVISEHGKADSVAAKS